MFNELFKFAVIAGVGWFLYQLGYTTAEMKWKRKEWQEHARSLVELFSSAEGRTKIWAIEEAIRVTHDRGMDFSDEQRREMREYLNAQLVEAKKNS